MQKKICFLLVCLFLTGCSSTKTELSVENTEENQAMLEINKIQLPLEQDCSVGSYCVDGDTVYYSVYMSVGDYGANPDTKFDDSMETEIRSYDTTSNEQKILYQYNAGYPVDVNDMGICEYAQGKLKTVQENVYVNSPYEHLSKWKDTYATAFKTDDGYEIVTIDEDGNYSDHETVSDVSELQMNDDYMTYLSDPYNYRNKVNVICKENHSVEQIKTDRFFNYGLLGTYLIFNKLDHITAYDLLSGEETELLKAEQDSFEWMFRRGETLCTKNGNDIYVLSMK